MILPCDTFFFAPMLAIRKLIAVSPTCASARIASGCSPLLPAAVNISAITVFGSAWQPTSVRTELAIIGNIDDQVRGRYCCIHGVIASQRQSRRNFPALFILGSTGAQWLINHSIFAQHVFDYRRATQYSRICAQSSQYNVIIPTNHYYLTVATMIFHLLVKQALNHSSSWFI